MCLNGGSFADIFCKAFHHRLTAVYQIRHGRNEEDALAWVIPWHQVVPTHEEQQHDEYLGRQRHKSAGFADTSSTSLLASSPPGTTLGSLRKMTFMGRLLGKNRRSAG